MTERTEKERRKRKGERPDGLIQVSLMIGYKPDGRPDRKYFYGHSRAEAERKRDAYKSTHLTGAKYPLDITVGEWVDVFKATYRKRVHQAYLKNDDVPYNRLVRELGKMRMVDIRETHLQNALNKTGGMSFSTVNKYIHVIKRVFRKARKNKIIADDPAEDLELPNYTKGSHRALDSWEVEHILANWDEKGVRCGLWVLLMMLCGLRRGEVVALRWEQINLDARTLSVCETAVMYENKTTIEQRAKSDAGLRVLPICKTLYAALLTVPEEKRSGHVCLSAHGTLLTDKAFDRGFDSFLLAMERIANGEPPRQAGRRRDIEEKEAEKLKKKSEPEKKRIIISFRPHDLRHTYATALYDAGVPVKAAQYFLGHADIKITLDLYTHLSLEREHASRVQMVTYLDKWVDLRKTDAAKLAALDYSNAQNEP